LRLAAGRVPVALAEVVVAAEMTAGVGVGSSGSGSDCRSSGMGVQAVSYSRKKEEKKRRVGSPDDHWRVSFDHPQTGTGAGRGSAGLLGIARGPIRLDLLHDVWRRTRKKAAFTQRSW